MFWEEKLQSLRDRGLHRVLRQAEGASAAHTRLEGRQVVLLCSNNYLGLTTHPRVVAAAREALEAYGAGSGGARLISGNFALHRALEREMAEWKGEEDALLFGSGYAANLGALTALAGPGDVILSDALNHASIIDGCRLSGADVLVYRHGDTRHLEELLRLCAGFRRRLIVTDSVFSMDGDLAPLPDIAALARRHDALTLVDEAHATGVLGAEGSGAVEHFGLRGRVNVQVSTLSKALGAEGGCVTGGASLVDYLRQRARSFIYSTAPSPPVVAAARAAVSVVREEPSLRRRLAANAAYLRRGLRRLGHPVADYPTPIVPVLLGEEVRAVACARALEERGVWAAAVRPPTVPPGTSRLRLSVMATHTRTDLETTLAALAEAMAEAGAPGGQADKGAGAWQASL